MALPGDLNSRWYEVFDLDGSGNVVLRTVAAIGGGVGTLPGDLNSRLFNAFTTDGSGNPALRIELAVGGGTVTTTGSPVANEVAIFSGASSITGVAVGSTGQYLRGVSASAPIWSTLILPNAATSGIVVMATSTDTYGEDATLTYSGGVLRATNMLASSTIQATGASSFIAGNASATTGSILFRNAVNANAVTLTSGTTSPSYTITLPTAQAASAGLPLVNNGAGVTTWSVLPGGGGGTGLSSYVVGDLLYADTTTTLAKRAAVATGQLLASAGVSTAPVWSASPTLTTSLTAPVLNATATASLTVGTASSAAGQILFKNATNANTLTVAGGVTSGAYTLTFPLAAGAAGTVVSTTGSGTLAFTAISAVNIFPLAIATLPDDTDTVNDPARIRYRVSTGSQTTNAPKMTDVVWLMSCALDEAIFFQFVLPQDYGSGGTLRFDWSMATDDSGNMNFKAGTAIVVPASSDTRALVSDTVVTLGATVIPGTLGQSKQSTLALTMTNAAAGRKILVWIASETTSTTATGDAVLESLSFEYVRA